MKKRPLRIAIVFKDAAGSFDRNFTPSPHIRKRRAITTHVIKDRPLTIPDYDFLIVEADVSHGKLSPAIATLMNSQAGRTTQKGLLLPVDTLMPHFFASASQMGFTHFQPMGPDGTYDLGRLIEMMQAAPQSAPPAAPPPDGLIDVIPGIKLNPVNETAYLNEINMAVPLYKNSYKLLLYLVSNPGRFIDRTELMEHLGYPPDQTSAFRTLLSRTRDIFKQHGAPDPIVSESRMSSAYRLNLHANIIKSARVTTEPNIETAWLETSAGMPKKIRIHLSTGETWINGVKVPFSETELAIIAVLAGNIGKDTQKEAIRSQIGGMLDREMATHTLDVNIGRIRAKLAARDVHDIIKTTLGRGPSLALPDPNP